MTMKEPNFAAFLSSFSNADLRDSVSGNLTRNYIITPESLLKNQFMIQIQNTLEAFSRPIGDTFLMMEEDLAGAFLKNAKSPDSPLVPFIRDGHFHYRGTEYDHLIMCPLLMDFSPTESEIKSLYYQVENGEKITSYAESTIRGMKTYYEKTLFGLFEFYPFIGVNPAAHSLEFIQDLFSKYVNVSHTFHPEKTVPEKPFYGIKLYPPLGMDPWPADEKEMKKVRFIYSFCEQFRIPVITHCDDQGFRGVPAKDAWHFTEPSSWRSVLENYPSLILDFAHMGKQYTYNPNLENAFNTVQNRIKKYPTSEWFYQIMDLMKNFENVYTDISFSATLPDFYPAFWNYYQGQDEETREKIKSRVLFGSDFSVNLMKIESYSAYMNKVEQSIFSDDFIRAISEENPLSFLGLTAALLSEEKKKGFFSKR
jgi:Predicted metal-dependent hydrolase of the TIM-barrel fold